MNSTVDNVRTLDDLRVFVHHTLCQKENLLADQFKMAELTLSRNDELCGLQFCLRGPRSVRLAAIWAAEHNAVYLYDAKGVRYSKLRLKHRIDSAGHRPAARPAAGAPEPQDRPETERVSTAEPCAESRPAA